MNGNIYVLSLDLGTGGVKASVVNGDFCIVSTAFCHYATYTDTYGGRRQRPEDWWDAVIKAVSDLYGKCAHTRDVAAVAISGHSMGRVPVDAKCNLLEEYTPIWSDTCPEEQADRFFKTVDYGTWYKKTGCGSPAPHYAVFKIMKLREECPDIYRRTAAFIGTKDYINMKLCGKICSDYSYATGSGLYNLADRFMSAEYVKASGIDPGKLPYLYNSYDVIGYVTAEAAQILGIKQGIPVCAGGVDNGCMALGAGCTEAGDTYCSLGSSAWIATVSESVDADLITKPYIFGHCIPGLKLTHEGIFSCGTSIDWVIDNMFPDLEREKRYALFDGMAETSPVGSHGLVFCPALAGGSSADPAPCMRGGFVRMDLAHTREDIARATLEGTVMQMKYDSESIVRNKNISRLILTGGGADSDILKQMYADIFNMDVSVTDVTRHTAALGAAALALVGLGVYRDFRFIKAARGEPEITHPVPANAEKYRVLQDRFDRIMKLLSEI